MLSRSIAVIAECGNDKAVLVADSDYNTILRLDDDLKFCKNNILLNRKHDGIVLPVCIRFVEDSKELIVGMRNGLINVYTPDILTHLT